MPKILTRGLATTSSNCHEKCTSCLDVPSPPPQMYRREKVVCWSRRITTVVWVLPLLLSRLRSFLLRRGNWPSYACHVPFGDASGCTRYFEGAGSSGGAFRKRHPCLLEATLCVTMSGRLWPEGGIDDPHREGIIEPLVVCKQLDNTVAMLVVNAFLGPNAAECRDAEGGFEQAWLKLMKGASVASRILEIARAPTGILEEDIAVVSPRL